MSALARRHRLPAGSGLHFVEDADMSELRFALLRLAPDEELSHTAEGHELLCVPLEGGGGVAVDGTAFELAPRASVFDDPPSALFAPPASVLEFRGPLLAGVFTASTTVRATDPYVIGAGAIETVTRGEGNFERAVRDILPRDRPAARLLVGETVNPAGNWSSSPPHKHDRHAPPEEHRLEEIYCYRVEPRQGFALQHAYSTDPPAEDTMVVRDLDVVAIPGAYHPVVAAPGYRLYYLWGLAGEERELVWFDDPAHSWLIA